MRLGVGPPGYLADLDFIKMCRGTTAVELKLIGKIFPI
jgi:hypothetical protein